ncbi:25848_t:CDS:2 [Gigaspora rosea]|nr:25848_t:CDS:2 [Gigaspora rosea]
MIVTPPRPTKVVVSYSNYDEYDDYYEQDLEEIRNPFYNNVQWCLSYSDSIKGLSNEGPFGCDD